MRELGYRSDAIDAPLEIEEHDRGAVVRVGERTVNVNAISIDDRYVTLDIDGKRHRVLYDTVRGHVHVAFGGTTLEFVPAEEAGSERDADDRFTPQITSPMPGKILDVFVTAGDVVEADGALILLEAMKMENTLRTSRKASVVSVHVAAGEMVAPGDTLLVLEEIDEADSSSDG